MMKKQLASISLDLDNLWSYLKIHGDRDWHERPSYFELFVPHVLDLLKDLDLEITFFVVGADAAEDTNRPYLRSLVEGGHEIANHSYEHESWLQLYSRSQLEDEITRSQESIEAATGVVPRGFRGPGFSWSPTLLEVLANRGFHFDASTLPTYLGPLARAYYFRTSQLSSEEKAIRAELFGKFTDGLRPSRAYHWLLADDLTLLEIPVTTVPIVKTPFHLSYLIYLSRFSPLLGDLYLRIALILCRMTRTEPSFLIHPLDLISGDQVPALRFFPGMDMDCDKKVGICRRALHRLGESFELVPMGRHAEALSERQNLPQRHP